MSKRAPIILIILLFIMVLSTVGYFAYRAYFTPEALKRREVAKWVEIIGEGISLPQGETPTLATVTNKDKLDDQPFFARAENGDKILIYPLTKKAFLYRPVAGKVIDMADVDIERER